MTVDRRRERPDAWQASIALLLVVSVSACSSTTRVALPSPALTEMNLRIHGSTSIITLRDGRQLEVEGLQVNVDQARGTVLRERAVALKDAPEGGWKDVADASKILEIPSTDIVRVVARTGRKKGAAIGTATGALVGGGAMGGVGYGVANADGCPPPSLPQPTECASSQGISAAAGFITGLIVGAVVFGVVGFLVGRRGVERTFVFEPAPGPEEPSPVPAL